MHTLASAMCVMLKFQFLRLELVCIIGKRAIKSSSLDLLRDWGGSLVCGRSCRCADGSHQNCEQSWNEDPKFWSQANGHHFQGCGAIVVGHEAHLGSPVVVFTCKDNVVAEVFLWAFKNISGTSHQRNWRPLLAIKLRWLEESSDFVKKSLYWLSYT